METLMSKYQALDAEAFEAFENILKEKGQIDFFTSDMSFEENLDELPMVDRSNSMGDTVFLRVLSVLSGGLLDVVEDENQTKQFQIGFSEINDIYFKINLVDEMTSK